MATTPQAQDPSESALSAIEDALNLTAAEGKDVPPASDASRLPKVDDNKDLAPRPRSTLTPPEPANESARRKAEPDAIAPSSKPANDDRRSVGQILQALQ